VVGDAASAEGDATIDSAIIVDAGCEVEFGFSGVRIEIGVSADCAFGIRRSAGV